MRVGEESQRCVDCEVDCSAKGDGKGVLACAPRSDVQLSPGGAALVQCYCANNYHVDPTSGRCVDCYGLCTLDGAGLKSDNSCSLSPPVGDDVVLQPRCHCSSGYIAEPKTGICISVAQVEQLTQLSNCQEVCLHSELVLPNGVLGCGVGIVGDSTLAITSCICDQENGYRLDGETFRCNSPFTVDSAIELLRAAAEAGIDPFEKLRKIDEFKNDPINFLSKEATSQGVSLESILPFGSGDDRRLKEIGLFDQLNSSSLAEFMAQVRDADAVNLNMDFSSSEERYSHESNNVHEMMQSYDKYVAISGPSQLHRVLSADAVPPIAFDQECFDQCSMVPGAVGDYIGALGCFQARLSGGDIKRVCMCLPGFYPLLELDTPYTTGALLFAKEVLGLGDLGGDRCTPCVGLPVDYLRGASPLSTLISSTKGCGRGKPWQWYKTECTIIRAPSDISITTGCGCSLNKEYYEYGVTRDRRLGIPYGGCLECQQQCSLDGSGDGVFECDITKSNRLEISAKFWRSDIPRIFDCKCANGYSLQKNEGDLYRRCAPAKCPIDFSEIVRSAIEVNGALVSCRFQRESVFSTGSRLPATLVRGAFKFIRILLNAAVRKGRRSDKMNLYLYFEQDIDCGALSPLDRLALISTPNLGLALMSRSDTVKVVYPLEDSDYGHVTTDGCDSFAEEERIEAVDVEDRRACVRDLEEAVDELSCESF